MLISLVLVFLFGPWQEVKVPSKPNEEFQLTIDYQFKTRSAVSGNSNLNIDYQNDKILKDGGSGPLPYLKVRFKMLKLGPQEVRVKVLSNALKTELARKVKEGEEFELDMGYTDDMKDRVTPFEYNVLFLSPDKEPISRVQLFIAEDGTFLVNGEKRGKF